MRGVDTRRPEGREARGRRRRQTRRRKATDQKREPEGAGEGREGPWRRRAETAGLTDERAGGRGPDRPGQREEDRGGWKAMDRWSDRREGQAHRPRETGDQVWDISDISQEVPVGEAACGRGNCVGPSGEKGPRHSACHPALLVVCKGLAPKAKSASPPMAAEEPPPLLCLVGRGSCSPCSLSWLSLGTPWLGALRSGSPTQSEGTGSCEL